LISNYSME